MQIFALFLARDETPPQTARLSERKKSSPISLHSSHKAILLANFFISRQTAVLEQLDT